MREKFAALILSHGRADRVFTADTLRKCGYTGEIYIVLDDMDEQRQEYIKRFGEEHCIIFDKEEAAKGNDTMDNFGKMNIVLHARNMCHKIAADLGLDYFVELDDDYTSFDFRFAKGERLTGKRCTDLDRVFESMLRFLDDSHAMVVALSQGGDFMAGTGKSGYWRKGLSRKAMNAFFCKTDKTFKFLGTINEDVNMYITYGSRGELIFSHTWISLLQKQTQANAGGLTDIYLDVGTFVKSFYSVMCMPSAVTVRMMGQHHLRMHHNIKWEHCVPMILNEKYKKQERVIEGVKQFEI